jgi:hypothetical protein
VVDPAWEGIIEWENGFTSFPVGPMVWRDTEDGNRRECIGLGRVEGKDRNVRICTVPKTWSPPAEPVETKLEDVDDSAPPPEQKTTTATTEQDGSESKTDATSESLTTTEGNFLKLTTQSPDIVAKDPTENVGAVVKTAVVDEEIKKLAITDETPADKEREVQVSEKVSTNNAAATLPTAVV